MVEKERRKNYSEDEARRLSEGLVLRYGFD